MSHGKIIFFIFLAMALVVGAALFSLDTAAGERPDQVLGKLRHRCLSILGMAMKNENAFVRGAAARAAAGAARAGRPLQQGAVDLGAGRRPARLRHVCHRPHAGGRGPRPRAAPPAHPGEHPHRRDGLQPRVRRADRRRAARWRRLFRCAPTARSRR